MDRFVRSIVVIGVFFAALLFLTPRARAETWQAPIGGAPLPVGSSRVVCGTAAGGWVVGAGGTMLRPPTGDRSIGKPVDVRVAATADACSGSGSTLTLIATGRAPTLDLSMTTLAIDEARLDIHGAHLRGVGVRWRVDARSGIDWCNAPESDATGERCSLAVGRGLPADTNATTLTWLAAGSRVASDVVTFDENARRVSDDDNSLHPARVTLTTLIAPDASIDLAGGTTSRVPLTHPEAVTFADCGAAECTVSKGAVVVANIANTTGALAIRLRLIPHVYLQHGDTPDAFPVVSVSVLPCSVASAAGEPLRGLDDTRIVVRLDARCASDARNLRYFIGGGRAAEVEDVVADAGAALILLRVGRVDEADIALTVSRAGVDNSVVGQTRLRTRTLPAPHTILELPEGGGVDFIPTNRPALVRFAQPLGGSGHLVLSPLPGIYRVTTRDGATTVQGERAAAGFVALRFAYRVDSLPESLRSIDLAVLVDPLERPMHDANVPAPLGASALGPRPLVELVCADAAGRPFEVIPGKVEHIPYEARDTCHLVFHSERLAPEDGAQILNLEVDVTRVDGAARPEAHISQPITLRAGPVSRYAWIRGVSGAFDHVTVRIAHSFDESHYVGAEELRTGAPAVQWSVIAGTSRARLYATTTIPTGLYRVSDRSHSGILTLNFGVVGRLTWLDSEGHEGFLGLEAGMMALGLPNDLDRSGNSLTQVATVSGIGLSVPIANRSLATETSINLHAWFEYEISRDLGSEPGSPFGFVFGPSISIGNIGANL